MAEDYPGDSVIPDAVMIYDRRRRVRAPPREVFPWLVQLGAGRAGWYLTARLERFFPRSWRAARTINPVWQNLSPGDRIEDYKLGMGEGEFFIVVSHTPPSSLVYRSERLGTVFTWSLMCHPKGQNGEETEVHLRFRGRIHRTGWMRSLLIYMGDWADWISTEPMLSGLAERCEKPHLS